MPLNTRFLLGAAVVAATCGATDAFEAKVASPNGSLSIGFSLSELGEPAYHVSTDGRALLSPSRLGFEPTLTDAFTKVADSRRSVRDSWRFEFGERADIPEAYEEMTIGLEHRSGLRVNVVMRAYDEGAAVRYEFPREQKDGVSLEFEGEHTEFRLPSGTKGYEEHGTEGPYELRPVSEIKPYCERPLTIVLPGGGYAAICEAGNTDYPRMMLSPLDGVEGALVSALGGRTTNTESEHMRHDPSVSMRPGDATPWRLLLVGKTPGELLENNYLLLNLSPPCRLADTSWIKPGKVMRAELTTASGKGVIDFAKTAGLSYVHFDADWYGPERSRSSDATRVEPARSSKLDIQEVVDYGNERGVGVLVYVNQIHLKSQLEEILPLYERWGIKGVKYGFVPVGPQAETRWLTDSFAQAAEHHLMVNVHDGFRANGINRTFPNLMTVEGIRGNERMPTAAHNCTLPFTRYLCGIGDYTVCYYSPRIQTTRAHQLAMAVVSFSPLQWIFWYDGPEKYTGEPEIEFFREVKTVWDETRVLEGEIGEYATIARRSGQEWFIGLINADQPRRTNLPMDFLAPDREYEATVYYDDPKVKTKTHVGVRRQRVTAESSLEVEMFKSGGAAIWIRPAPPE
ncbi:Retaining alpha-galactosidase precursor [Pirellulimonas nuda]|uniref:Retaining alpha-galactosidase n=1 Tax=Pirellulimonas nuda TaxID=2528009 RepID=A0A518DBH0_9BACT|nr:glycoside hydrolase family 97 protein [Pirellulimonas nuda]QDU88819.1 Retaining alpha-galactosidase precursor [Pirellulimonas nuda]